MIDMGLGTIYGDFQDLSEDEYDEMMEDEEEEMLGNQVFEILMKSWTKMKLILTMTMVERMFRWSCME